MIRVSQKEAYGMFLESDWWKALSFERRKRSKFTCERCGKEDHCQAHHRIYRENWFDTRMEDLECICRECHEKEHGLSKSARVDSTGQGWTKKSLNQARSLHRISREEYLRIRNANDWGPMKRGQQPKPRKPKRPKVWKKAKKHRGQSMESLRKTMKQWGRARPNGMNIHKKMNWVSRDRSSN